MPVCKKCGRTIASTMGQEWICQSCYEARLEGQLQAAATEPELGFDVWVRLTEDSPFKTAVTWHNVTEIRYGVQARGYWKMVLESDIHNASDSFLAEYIIEFIVTPATKLAEEF